MKTRKLKLKTEIEMKWLPFYRGRNVYQACSQMWPVSEVKNFPTKQKHSILVDPKQWFPQVKKKKKEKKVLCSISDFPPTVFNFPFPPLSLFSPSFSSSPSPFSLSLPFPSLIPAEYSSPFFPLPLPKLNFSSHFPKVGCLPCPFPKLRHALYRDLWSGEGVLKFGFSGRDVPPRN